MALTLATDLAQGYPISIASDSKYALDSICRGYAQWDQGYNSNGKNSHWDLICEIRELMDYFPCVTFYKCQAHSENTCYGNNAADSLAREAIQDHPDQGDDDGDFIR
jgi:ribonuclease HI